MKWGHTSISPPRGQNRSGSPTCAFSGLHPPHPTFQHVVLPLELSLLQRTSENLRDTSVHTEEECPDSTIRVPWSCDQASSICEVFENWSPMVLFLNVSIWREFSWGLIPLLWTLDIWVWMGASARDHRIRIPNTSPTELHGSYAHGVNTETIPSPSHVSVKHSLHFIETCALPMEIKSKFKTGHNTASRSNPRFA